MEDQIVSAPWLLRLGRRAFTLWLLLYGVTALVSPNERLPVSSLTDVGNLINVQPRFLLGAVFLIPGILSLIPRLHPLGLLSAIAFLSVFEVGLIIGAIEGTGTYTAPITFGFVTALAAFLLTLRDVK